MRTTMTSLVLLAFVLILGSTSSTAHGDYLVLRSGEVLVGELIEKSRRGVKFRFELEGIWATKEFKRAEYDEFVEQEGDQSDQSGESDPAARGDGAGPAPGGRTVAVIPLEGTVGFLGRKNYFTAAGVQAGFEEARKNGAELIILRIDSPGGLVDEMEAICDVVLDWQERIPIVAWPHEALSAAAIITLCCKKIVVAPKARIGAAVIIRGAAGDMDAVEAKFASPHYARQRQYMERSGHPYALVAAMTIQKKSLWRSADDGSFTTDENRATRGVWDRIDDEESILTMTAKEAIDWGVAQENAQRADDILPLHHISGDITIADLGPVLAGENRRFEAKLERLVEEFAAYFQSIIKVRTALTEYAEAARQQDRRAGERARKACANAVQRASRARRKIANYERIMLGARFEEPGQVVEQMARDKDALARLTRSLREATIAGFNEAVTEFNGIVDAWSRLFES